MVKITHEQYINSLNNQYVEVLGKYTGADNKIQCRCTICNEIYYPKAYDVKIGKKHFKCAHKIATKKRTKTIQQFKEEMKEVNPNIEIIGEYKNAKENILCLCMIHNITFDSSPTHLLTGKIGCKECIKEKYRTEERKQLFYNNIKTKNIEILSDYKSRTERIDVKCLKCGFIWHPVAEELTSGYGCPHCVGRHKTTNEFIAEMKTINPYITILGEYVNSSTNIECSCNVCGYVWYPVPSNLRVSGCPMCNTSHGERAIRIFLDRYKIYYEYQKKYDGLVGLLGGQLSYDFYIPSYNLLIEYQGEYHDGTVSNQTEDEFAKQQEHDRRKRTFANNNKINLLEIWYWDYDNINKILERELHIDKLNPVTITEA